MVSTISSAISTESLGARGRGVARGALLLVILVGLVCVTTTFAHANARGRGYAAQALDGADTATLHLVRPGETLLEEGAVAGILPGRMRAELNIGVLYTGKFTIYTHGGQVSGTGRATPHGSGRYQSFAGSLTVTHGSGAYAHVHGRDSLYGVFDRRTYAVLVKTVGRLSY